MLMDQQRSLLLHSGSLSPAGTGVVSLTSCYLGLVSLHLGLAVSEQRGVDGDVFTCSA